MSVNEDKREGFAMGVIAGVVGTFLWLGTASVLSEDIEHKRAAGCKAAIESDAGKAVLSAVCK